MLGSPSTLSGFVMFLTDLNKHHPLRTFETLSRFLVNSPAERPFSNWTQAIATRMR